VPDIVLFSLWAPLAAMGDVAVGERRGGFDRPGRSAVLGLVAAALGLDRADEDAHAALDEDYLVALRVLARGELLQDCHTIQAPAADRKARWATRRAALDRPSHRLETLLSLRDYRAEPFVDVALVPRPGGSRRFAPDRLVAALARPAFTLFFGRKACPLGLPPNPVCVPAGTLGEAFRQVDAARPPDARSLLTDIRADPSRAPLYADLVLDGADLDMLRPDYRPQRVERRRDRPLSRRRWQFELRDEVVALPAPSAP